MKKNVIMSLCFLVMAGTICLMPVFSQSGVSIDSLDPASGLPGTIVKIMGEGFSVSNDTVMFRSTDQPSFFYMAAASFIDEYSINFAIPPYLNLACHYDPVPCAAPNLGTIPGVYEVFIGTMDTVDSNTLYFTVPAETGDVNGDSVSDIIDALLVAQYYVGLNPSALEYPEAADVNCDIGIDIIDALLIAQYYVGIIGEFPECIPAPTPAPTPIPSCGLCTMTITGHVTDTGGNPIQGANIYMFDDSLPPEATTDASGYYEFTLTAQGGGLCPVSDLSLYVTAPGYQPVGKAIVSRCSTVIHDFSLAEQ